ncbi:MAG TPA: hypothetical protein DCK77_01660 [Shigella sp.]|nr:hypothetical protein [Shigella sp.]
MSTIVIFLAALLACSLLAGWLIKVRSRRRQLPWTNAFADAQTRKLTPEERSAVENYLESLTQVLQVPGPTGASAAPISLALNAESNNVMMLTHAITRYGISTDDPNKWRYYLDSVEVHLPPFWEQYINDENTVELIHTDSLPLVISLNGHTLQEYMQETRSYALQPVPSTQASIRGEESEQIELLNIRKETHEEYALSRPRGLREALLIVASFLMFFFCLITPDVFVPWLAGGALLLLGAGLWGLFAPPAKSSLREIHCLRGTPRRWGLFGENDQEQINNISLGIIDLVYPAHWQPYIAQDLGQQTDIDIYLDRHVVRQGRYLSLHDEVKNFPLQHWLRSTIIAAGSLLVLFMLLGIQLGFWSLLFSHITFCLPFVVVTVYSRLKGFDVRMLEAAKDLGASEFTILRKIILQLAMPAVAAGWVLSFTMSMDDVVVSSFVTGPSYEILPLKIYSMVKVGVSPEVNALATILLVLSLVMVIASQLIARDKTKGNTGDVK